MFLGIVLKTAGITGTLVSASILPDDMFMICALISFFLVIAGCGYLDLFFLGRDITGIVHEEWEGTLPWDE